MGIPALVRAPVGGVCGRTPDRSAAEKIEGDSAPPRKPTAVDTPGAPARFRGSTISKHAIQTAGVMLHGRLMSNGTDSRTLYYSALSITIS